MLDNVINKAELCRLALVDGTKPYIIPLSFGYDGTNIYLHSASNGKKVDILSQNNQVCLEFEADIQLQKSAQVCNWGVRYLTVIGHGTAELLSEMSEKNYGLAQIVRHYDPSITNHQFAEEELATVLVYKISLDELVGKISG